MEDEIDLPLKEVLLNKMVAGAEWIDKTKFFDPKYAIFDVVLLSIVFVRPFLVIS